MMDAFFRGGWTMKLTVKASLACAALAAATSFAVSEAAYAQAKEQFFPVLVYRTGPYAPNGVPFANGYVD
jgi:branched-chain amino acid transport system substrate-binding protein